jgi:hypothetical protein
MRVWTFTVCLIASSLFLGCGNKAQEEDEFEVAGPKFSRDEEGNIVREFDIDGDDKPDVTKVFAEYPDPDDPSVMRQRLIRKEVDVNSDGNVNMRRSYNEDGELMLEEADTDLDGTIDVVRHIDNGQLIQKDLLDPESGVVLASRYYFDGEIQRVEKDTDRDDKVDYWEFYEQGVLDRIGRDLNGDGRADTWQRR